jgi:hypothetical protein
MAWRKGGVDAHVAELEVHRGAYGEHTAEACHADDG